MARKFVKKLRRVLGQICAVLLVTYPSLAHAAAAPLIAIAAQWAATAGITIAGITITAGMAAVISIGATVFGAAYQRRKAKRAAARARQQFLDSLQDRFVTTLRADPPQRIVYGTAITGGDIAAILTSDKQHVSTNGSSYTLPDGYKHIVLMLAAHEVQGIDEVYIEGVPVGTLDANGWATGGEFGDTKKYTMTKELAAGASYTFPNTVTLVSAGHQVGYQLDASWVSDSVTVNGAQVTNPNAYAVLVTVTYQGANSRVRIEKFLGTADQAASSYLMSVCPDEWTSTDRLRGIAYIIVTLDLEEQRFQGGPPQISASVRGRKVYDPRTGTTVYSRNPALICRDYITSEWGFDADDADIDDASVIAAANACDEVIDILILNIPVTTGPKYTCDGVITSDDAPETVLEEMAGSMAGFATYSGGKWVINAGKYTAPVLALDDDDLAAPIEIVQAGAAYEDLFNCVRGQLVEFARLTPTDLYPYKNTTLVTADGVELWEDMNFPFTNNQYRARCLARIRVEQARDSLIVRYPAKLVAWPVQIGDRVSITSSEYGWTAKTFRVTDWQFEVGAPVVLTLQEDVAAIYDLADSASTDQAQNTGLPSPWIVPAVTGISATSGNTTALIQSDGTVLDRVLVTWTRVASAYVTQGGKVVIRWARVSTSTVWNTVEVTGDSTSAYLVGVRAGDQLTISVRAVNSFGSVGPDTVISHTVAGKSDAPATPTGLSGTVGQGIITWKWDYPPEADWAETVARTGGTDWATASDFWVGRATTVLQRVTAAATYTLRIKNRNTSGIESTAAASASVVVSTGDLVQSEPGDPGLGVAIVRLYQWASAQPSNPNSTGRSTYTWATGAHAADGSYPVGNGWTVGSVPANPGTAGIGLWVAEKSITAPAGTTTSTVIWDGGYSVYKMSANGAAGTAGEDGVDGLKSVTVEVFKWAASIPTAPAGTSTYTWATKSFAAPSGWALTTTGGNPGETLYAARVTLLDAASATTTSIDWTTSSILAVGYRGLDGATGGTGATGPSGPQGVSAKRAYVLTTAASLGSGTVTTTGTASLPPDGSFGANGWTATPSTPATGQVLYQSDGLYNPVTDQITWYTPYISALKVGNLSALAVNTGALTVSDTLTIGTTGNIQGGATTFALGNGIWQGYDAGSYKWRVGTASGARAEWNGTSFTIYNSSNQAVFSSGGTLNWSQLTGTPPASVDNASVTLSGLGFTGDTNATRNALTVSATAPTSPVNGDLWFDTTNSQWKVRSGGAWTIASDITATKTAAAITGQGAFATLNQITAANISTYIAAAAISNAYIANATISLAKIDTATITNLAALNANTGSLTVSGNLTLGTSGKIYTSGKTTYNSATAGVFLGYGGTYYQFGVGNSTEYIRWSGTALEVGGDIIATGNVKARNITVPAGGTVSSGAISTSETTNLTTAGSISPGGQPLYVIFSGKTSVNSGFAGILTVRIKHGATVLRTVTINYASGGYSSALLTEAIWVDAASTSGVLTVTTQMNTGQGGSISGSLFALGMLR